MSYAEIVSSLALLVSCSSFAIAYLSFRRTTRLDEPNAWAELEPIDQPNCWKVKVTIKNPTRYPLKLESLSVPIERVPIDAKQDFTLSPTAAGLKPQTQEAIMEAMKTGAVIGVFLKMPLADVTVAADRDGSIEAYIKRGSLSAASEARLTLHYCAMLETPRYRTITLRARIPGGGMTLHLSRTG